MDAFVKMLEFYGGVPVLVTVDNFKAAISSPRNGSSDAIPTQEFQELADFYGFGLKAARVRKPKDKALVENGVGIVQNDILAPLRDRRFFSLSDLNNAIQPRLIALNVRPLTGHLGESRNEIFDRIDANGFLPLPTTRFEHGDWYRNLRAGRDYHIYAEGSRYSVPARFANQLTNVKVTNTTVHIHHLGRLVATHQKSNIPGSVITTPEHMPPAHRSAALTRLAGLKGYVRDIGPNAERLIDDHFRINKRPQETANTAVKLRTFIQQYSAERVDSACRTAITVGKPTAKKVELILSAGLDQVTNASAMPDDLPAPKGNIRGASYFAELLNSPQGDKRDV